VAALAGASFALAGVTALGAFADGAAPGQILYPVDRVFESAADLVGVSRDRSAERLEELIRVIDRGDQDTAVRFLPEVVVAVERRTGVPLPEVPARRAVESAPLTTAAATPAPDPVTALKLAAEALRQGVRASGSDGIDLEAATTEFYLVAGNLTATVDQAVGVETTTTTPAETVLPGQAPTTTVPSDGSTTTTTAPSDESTTTTTAPSDESTTTTTVPADDGKGKGGGQDPGPIILPPMP
jgi:hypothetical protein